MLKSTRIILVSLSLIALYIIASGGCVTDPIKAIKNNPDKMDILMNHIANDDKFREMMVQKLISTGDRIKLSEQLCSDEDMGKKLMTKILDTPWGQEDMITRSAGQEERLVKVITKALTNFTNKEPILNALLANPEMVEYMRTSEKLKAALAAEPSKPEEKAGK
jgi:hypothetical protein